MNYTNYIDSSYNTEADSHYIIYVDPFKCKRYRKIFYNKGFMNDDQFILMRQYNVNIFSKYKKFHGLDLG